MRPFRDIPIQRKLRVVILSVCSAALIVACGVLFFLQYLVFRRDFERDLAAVAEIVASASTAAVTFEDEDAAREILAALKAKPHITGAAIVLRNGTELAQIGDASLPAAGLPKNLRGLRRVGDDLIFAQPIVLEGDQVGTLLLHPDYRLRQNELFRLYAGILAVVLLTSFFVAALLSWRLEQLILNPIRYLAQVSRNIAGRNDYSLRAEIFVDDEIGSFTDSFNSMLDQIEQRDSALRHEIAERKRTEEELQTVHSQLLEASRQAGMAEVATGVLHNVGNVLNSVNVSATLVAEKLGQSRTENLLRATELLRAQDGNLASFLASDERGRLLPGYLTEMGTHLATERTEALQEIDLLRRNIDHIKDIVALQQGFARAGGLIEPLSLVHLLEDALRMNAAAFARDGISVVWRSARVRPVAADRHKVLQILLNLLQNAQIAMKETPAPERVLTLTVREKPGSVAEARLTDCGLGIAAENLTRIFAHGFTTRKDGHGFGLHSAALAVQEMGGHLSAESEGLGRGATFILELPLAGTRRQLTPARS